jgi:predicted transcriptional regulator
MNVKRVIEELDLTPVAGVSGIENEITGAYVGDLLSWVMGHARNGNLWVTVQAHVNVIAVACLLELAAVIICEGVDVDDETIRKADEEGIPVLTTGENAYSVCCKLNKIGV